jgi:predicted dehydrogenase
MRELRDIVSKKQLGQICQVDAKFLLLNPLGKTHSWWHESDKGGGAIGAIGVHIIDSICYLTGLKFKRVMAEKGTIFKDKEVKGTNTTKKNMAEDWAAAWGYLGEEAQTEGNVFVSVVMNFASFTHVERKIFIAGTEGSAVVDLDQGTLIVKDKLGKEVTTVKETRSVPEPFGEGTYLLAQALNNFKTTPTSVDVACPLSQGLHNQAVIDRMRVSNGKWLAVSTSPKIEEAKL